MNVNEWSPVFFNKLETFDKCEDFILICDEVLNRIGVAVCFPSTCVNFLCLSNDFERILNRCWGLSDTDYWTHCKLKIHHNVLWFASKIYIGRHLCDAGCISQTHYGERNRAFVKEAKCIFLQEKIINSRAIQLESRRSMKEENKTFGVVALPIENYVNDRDNVSDFDPNNTPFDALKLKFKKLSENAIAPTRATEASVSYDLYAAEKCSILPQSKGLVPTDIALHCPKNVYPRIAPRSSVAMKNTDVGARVIDNDYKGNMRVLISNHSAEAFNIEAGDRKAQFALTRYKASDIVEVSNLKQTICASNGFGISGI